ncbi:MAG TPA: hypothetical protein VN747_01730 [Burkholderiales bacterium]|nr:hypothetical protein [Burkholderiales bacterium]
MKLPRLAVLALLLLAGGCATERTDPIPKDGEMSRKITWVITEDTQTACRNAGRRPLLYKTLGCAVWKDSGNCVIYARPPRTEDDRRAMETLGHEMLHCFAGHFHHQP